MHRNGNSASRRTSVSIGCLMLMPLALSAQGNRDAAPLKYWSAPTYWQPSTSERSASGRMIATASSTAAAGNALMFVGMTPCRVIDTRSIFGFPAPFGAPSLVASTTRSFPLQASTLCSIPAGAAAYSLNITVTPIGTTSLGFLTVWPVGSAQPNASTLNNPSALPALANAAIVPAGNDTSGSINAFASSATDLIVDINGYYISPTIPGTLNTVVGSQALTSNTTGSVNTAVGSGAMENNTTGSSNTAVGANSLKANTGGVDNVANGYAALTSNTSGSGNTAAGFQALTLNTSGATNSAIGSGALQNNTTGSSNVAIGNNAAVNVAGGANNNIHIGNVGLSADNNTTRIGAGTQTSFFIAGVSGISTGLAGAVPVLIDANGQLGTASSSARFKEDIQDMGGASDSLMQLRPVTFRYKQPYIDGTKPLDYGLIAEEVAKVYPDLVVRDAQGQIQTVQYQKLTPMLLNEVQKLQERIAALESALAAESDN